MDPRIQQLQEPDSPSTPQRQQLSPSNDQDAAISSIVPTALATKGTKRGRKAQDPQQVIRRVDCNGQNELERALDDFIHDGSLDRYHTLFEASLPVSAAFLVDYGPAASGAAKSNSYKYGPAFAPGVGPVKDGHVARSMSVMEALEHSLTDPKERMRKQRAISRSVENAVEQVDGHRYAFHNEWLARDNDAYRFSYFCNDSLLNKDRTLGGVKKNDEGKVKRARKQVYDCQGYLTIKFSSTKQDLEVLYKHIPLHPTYDERAPLPRVGTKRFEVLQRNNPNHELIQRAKEREARKQLFSDKAKEKPHRRKSIPKTENSPPRATDPNTTISKYARRKSDEGEDVPPDSATGFRFRNFNQDNHPVAKRAKRSAAQSGENEAAASPGTSGGEENNELARMKARLEAAEQYIKSLETNGSPRQPSWRSAAPPPGFAPGQGQPGSKHPNAQPEHYPPPVPACPPPPVYPAHISNNMYDQSSPYPHHPAHPQARSHTESIAAAANAATHPHPHPSPSYNAHPMNLYHQPQHAPLNYPPYYTPLAPSSTPSTQLQKGRKAMQFNHYTPKAKKGSQAGAENKVRAATDATETASDPASTTDPALEPVADGRGQARDEDVPASADKTRHARNRSPPVLA